MGVFLGGQLRPYREGSGPSATQLLGFRSIYVYTLWHSFLFSAWGPSRTKLPIFDYQILITKIDVLTLSRSLSSIETTFRTAKGSWWHLFGWECVRVHVRTWLARRRGGQHAAHRRWSPSRHCPSPVRGGTCCSSSATAHTMKTSDTASYCKQPDCVGLVWFKGKGKAKVHTWYSASS